MINLMNEVFVVNLITYSVSFVKNNLLKKQRAIVIQFKFLNSVDCGCWFSILKISIQLSSHISKLYQTIKCDDQFHHFQSTPKNCLSSSKKNTIWTREKTTYCQKRWETGCKEINLFRKFDTNRWDLFQFVQNKCSWLCFFSFIFKKGMKQWFWREFFLRKKEKSWVHFKYHHHFSIKQEKKLNTLKTNKINVITFCNMYLLTGVERRTESKDKLLPFTIQPIRHMNGWE